ncbi:hypothetical protein [Rhizobium sp. C4]|uniref:hypothetical protein n=1 Tax=Rhizobium sp. C4 TaxID=1349800 RepID=UPI001E5E5D0D|nr:hypothetical protein [Rhizobium sp. C4]MCD2172105.1 hypothetical protein [Rhizobium sp. C4]
MAAYLPFLCLAIAFSWSAFASGYRMEAAVSRMELATIVLGSSIFLGAIAMLFVNGTALVAVALLACGIALALLGERFIASRWSLLAAATSFGSYLVGTVH